MNPLPNLDDNDDDYDDDDDDEQTFSVITNKVNTYHLRLCRLTFV